MASNDRGRRPGPAEPAVEPVDVDAYLGAVLRRERAGERTRIEVGPHSLITLHMIVQEVERKPRLAEWAPDMFAALADQFAAILAADPDGEQLRRRRAPVALEVGRYSALLLLASIEWFLRIPGAEGWRVFLDPVREQLEGLFADDVAGQAVLATLSRTPGSAT